MRGVTLEEISAATKIGVRFLEAIEAEEFSKLPGGIFIRSFVRSYAKYVGLDEEHILSEYQLIAEPREDFTLHRLGSTKPRAVGQSSRSPVLTLVLAALLLSGGYALYHYSRQTAEMPTNASTSVQVPAVPPPSPIANQSPTTTAGTPPAAVSIASKPGSVAASENNQPAVGTTPSSATQSSSTGTNTAIIEPKNGLVLQLAATEAVWVGVEADGKMALQRILKPNEVETLKAKEFFDVTIGNAEGIVLTLNGETLKPLGRRGEVKSVHLTHDDLKNSAL